MNVKKEIVMLVGIVFLLMGTLFGVNIISFIFGNLGTEIPTLYTDNLLLQQSVINESGFTINNTVAVSVAVASGLNYSGGFNLLEVNNGTTIYPIANFTTTDSGTITVIAADNFNYTGVNVSYNYTAKSQLQIDAENIINQSLQAELTYASNATNQMNIVNVTIILALLIFLFFLFWKVIQGVQSDKGSGVGSRKKGSGDPSKSSFS